MALVSTGPRPYERVELNVQGRVVLYNKFQVQGQKFLRRELGPSQLYARTELHVSNVPRSASIESLCRFLSQVGDVLEVRLLMEFSGFNRGFGFVRYETVEASRAAICCLNGEFIETESIYIKLSYDNNILVMESIPNDMFSVVEAYIHDHFGEGLVHIGPDANTNVPGGYRLYYATHAYAAQAHKKAYPGFRIGNTTTTVTWSVPEMANEAKNFYFIGYPAETSKFEIFRAFVGKIPNLSTLVTLRHRSVYGYATFTNFREMKTAYAAVRDAGVWIQGHKLKFSLRRFDLPHPRRQNMGPPYPIRFPISFAQQFPCARFNGHHYPHNSIPRDVNTWAPAFNSYPDTLTQMPPLNVPVPTEENMSVPAFYSNPETLSQMPTVNLPGTSVGTTEENTSIPAFYSYPDMRNQVPALGVPLPSEENMSVPEFYSNPETLSQMPTVNLEMSNLSIQPFYGHFDEYSV